MNKTMIGIDLAKSVFHAHGASMTGRVRFNKKLKRAQFRQFMSEQSPCVVVFEACGSASCTSIGEEQICCKTRGRGASLLDLAMLFDLISAASEQPDTLDSA